jgi:hypothetical protein
LCVYNLLPTGTCTTSDEKESTVGVVFAY